VRQLVIAIALILAALPASAQKKAKPTCGIDFLPFTPGTTWVYQAVAPDEQKPPRGIEADAPEEVTIKVVAIDTKGATSTISLEESYRKVVVQTTIECSTGSMMVDPSSFFWAGEPGGGQLMKLVDLKRTGTSYPGAKGLKKGTTLNEEFKATVERKAATERAKIPSGKVEMEREMVIGDREVITTSTGDQKAFRVDISLSGRGTLDGDKAGEREMAAGAKAVLWFAPGQGLVKVINRFNQAWLLK